MKQLITAANQPKLQLSDVKLRLAKLSSTTASDNVARADNSYLLIPAGLSEFYLHHPDSNYTQLTLI